MHLNVANDTSSHSIGLVPVQTGPSSVRGPGERDLKNDNRFSQETNPIEDVDGDISKGLKTIVVCCITYSTGITTFLAGVVTMALPVINADLRLPSNLQLWPVTIYSLTCGCTLLICGSIADVVGNRQTYLVACFLQCVFTVACGFAKTGTQMIVFRAFSGVAASFSLPSSVSLINEVFPPGQSRNIAFASMGGAQPIGFGIGLVLGGIITGSIGWKWGFFVAAISNAVMLVISAWYLPKNAQQSVKVWHRIAADIDWIGVILASVSLALLSYIIAAITGSPLSIKLPQNITLLILSFALMLAFVLWVGRQERLGRPALIPNTLWKHKAFSCICVNDFCIWAAFNAFEQYQNFFFQEVQDIIHRVRADWIVIMTTIPCVIASVLMAVAELRWSYWTCAFIANFLNPIGADGIFTVSNLLITSMFPPKTQGVAGGVFNTISQTGKSVGMALTALVANEVTRNYRSVDKPSSAALLVGYRASFWFCVALVSVSLCISALGLRRIGKMGKKSD